MIKARLIKSEKMTLLSDSNNTDIGIGAIPSSPKSLTEKKPSIEADTLEIKEMDLKGGVNNKKIRIAQYQMAPMDSSRMNKLIADRGYNLWWSDVEKEQLTHGESNLLPSSFLSTAQERSRAVAFIETNSGVGSGFMVSDKLLVTARHVLESKEVANSAVAIFDYNDEVPQGQRVKDFLKKTTWSLDPSTFFIENEKLDLTVVALKSDTDKKITWNPIPLCTDPLLLDPNEAKNAKDAKDAKKKQALNIIQHPNGRPKRFAFRGWKLNSLSADYVEYDVDTMHGSSGSPVFNDYWELIAVHHSGKKDELVNQGTHISSLLNFLLNQDNYTDDQKRLVADLKLGK